MSLPLGHLVCLQGGQDRRGHVELCVNKDSLSCQLSFITRTHTRPTGALQELTEASWQLCPTAEMCSMRPGQSHSRWLKGMTWEWGRAAAPPSSSSPSSPAATACAHVYLLRGESGGPFSSSTVFSEGHF